MNKSNYPNQLRQIRLHLKIPSKQVAKLLGHKKAESLSRYESGAKVPSLKTAMKLAMIYDIPVRTLLGGYYEVCRAEIKREAGGGARYMFDERLNKTNGYCTYSEAVRTIGGDNHLENAHRHMLDLIRLRGDHLERSKRHFNG